MTTNNDQILINQIIEGDTNAFSILVDNYKDLVFTLALRMLKNREEAEEVAQDTFIKTYRSLDRFKGDSKFSTWIYRVAYNTCLDRIKKNKKHLNDVEINEFTAHQVKTMDTALDQIETKEREEAIQRCIKRLPSQDSFLLTLYYFDDLSLDDISQIVGITVNSIKVKLFRCRKKLATILKSELEPEIIEHYERERR
ncbi:sigma-70 family RNA polymerase sigma factor [uncultured Psychroserpens sp.]|uniref:RNA polymerase sigma factor n=1 Tax=uncultured Psychroserpens sp. TaxID=255436 RepID=UPI002606E0CC|nr:sigma-70 family RNA polymerase sigma factor [uncultured Psychroserpens sp.]